MDKYILNSFVRIPERFLRQLLRRYLVRVQLRLLRFPINDVIIRNVARLIAILRRLGAWRRAVYRVVSPQHRPRELAEAGSAWGSDLRDRFGAGKRRGCRRRGRWRRGATIR